MKINIEPINKAHGRRQFDCGNNELNYFIRHHARQNHNNHISNTFIAIDEENETNNVIGFYTLASGQVNSEELPVSQNHPKYPVSIARLARLAIDKGYQGQGLGGYLLFDALNKVLAASALIGIYAIVVDAKDEIAKAFYQHYGFEILQNSELTLMLPMDTLTQVLNH